jgi:hypothetical protein
MTDKERICYSCAGKFIWQGELVSIPRRAFATRPGGEGLVGVLLGLTSIESPELRESHLRILVDGMVHVVPKRLVIPWERV